MDITVSPLKSVFIGQIYIKNDKEYMACCH